MSERQEVVTGERYCLVRMPFSFQFRNELVDVLGMLIGSQRRRWKIVKPRVKSGALCAQLPEQLPLVATEVNGSNPERYPL